MVRSRDGWVWVGIVRILGFYSKRNGKPLKDSEWYDRLFCSLTESSYNSIGNNFF